MPYPFQTLFQNFFIQNLCTNCTDTSTPYRLYFRRDQRSGFHKYPHPYNPHKPIHQRHCPHTPQIPHPYSPTNTHANQSTSDTVPQPHSTDSAPIQPHKHTQPHSPTNTHNHTQPPTDTHSLHTHTASTDTHRHDDAAPAPDVDVVDAPDADVDAVAPTLTPTRRRCCSTDLVAIGQAKQTGSGHPSAIGQASIRQAKYRIRLDRPD